MCFTCGNFTTDRQRLEVGIVTGDEPSYKSAEKLHRCAVPAGGIQQAPIRAFMDDLTITAKSVPQGRWILDDLVELTNWARMEIKPAKSRSLILMRGRVEYQFLFQFFFKIREDIIPTVQEKPVRSLGKWYRADLNDKESVKEMFIQAETWMTSLEKSGLPSCHPYLGCTVLALSLTQPITAVFRPAPQSPRRYLFNWVHRSTGTLVQILAVVCIFLGFQQQALLLRGPGTTEALVGWLLWILLSDLGLQLYSISSTRTNNDLAQAELRSTAYDQIGRLKDDQVGVAFFGAPLTRLIPRRVTRTSGELVAGLQNDDVVGCDLMA
ncbi:putative ferric-chelate reductase 1 [Merluccius polli]|uniref:Ferric-chelate reductase 1 n=1 Tax=Merluccius polli TaxID=89951 RepID=A0AA47PAD2_MERPO|nr:putative ferric-chelate reductase 1 [Merluccius polli]